MEARAFLGRIYLQQGQLAFARIAFLKLKKAQADPNLWSVSLAKIYFFLGFQEAVLELRGETLNARENSALAYWKGEALLQLNKYNEAKKSFETSQKLALVRIKWVSS